MGGYRRKLGQGTLERDAPRLRGVPASTGGGAGAAPNDALYLTLQAHADLTAERVFTPGFGLTPTDGGAGGAYALVVDQTMVPAWTGEHSFTDGIAFTGASDANEITIPDNVAIAFELEDAGGFEYLRIVSTNAQPQTVLNPDGQDIDLTIQAFAVADAFQVRGSDGQITLGALGAGFVQSTAGGVLSSAPIIAGDLPAHTHAGAGQGGQLDWDDVWSDAVHSHANAGEGGTITHAITTGRTANDHHNEVHVINSTGPHAEAGLTIGHVLRATGPAAFSFAALIAADIPALGGVPALTYGVANAAGVATTYVRTDASLAIFDANNPTSIDVGDAAAVGVAAFAARRDHQHAVTSSSNPGANARILASNGFGQLQLENIGVGVFPGTVAVSAQKAGVTDAIVGIATGSGRGVTGGSASGIGVNATSSTGIGLLVDLTGAGTTIADFQDNGTSVFIIQNGGLVGISETVNANMTIGLTIDQGANDNEILNLRSSDVGAVSSVVETGTYCTIKKYTNIAGGVLIRGFRDADGANHGAIIEQGFIAENPDTTKTTAARSIIELWGLQTDGSSTINTVANGNVVGFRTRRGGAVITVAFIDEDGDFYYNGALVNYDDENDALAAWDLSHVLSGEWNKIIEYGADKLEQMGVIGPADERGNRMVSNKRMNALQLGAIGQGYFDRQDLWTEVQQLRKKCQRYELALSNAGLLPA